MSIELAVQLITILIFLGTVLGAAMKYGSDREKLESKNQLQDQKIETIEKAVNEEKVHNARQHEEFYQNQKTTIKIESDIGHILSGLDDIKKMLGDRRGQV